jgi:hypothetical protein
MAKREAAIRLPDKADGPHALGVLTADMLGHRLRTELKFTPPFDWNAMLAYLAPRAIPGVEFIQGNAYARTLTLDGRFGLLQVTRESEDALSLDLATEAAADLREVQQRPPRSLRMPASWVWATILRPSLHGWLRCPALGYGRRTTSP